MMSVLHETITLDLRIQYQSKPSFEIRDRGIQLVETPTHLRFYTDPFRSVPLFVAQQSDGGLILFSDFRSVAPEKALLAEIDEVGFWSIVLFGMSFWTRTLYRQIQQVPGAAYLEISKRTGQFTIARYWDFDVAVDPHLDTREKIADGLLAQLDRIFADLPECSVYLSGLSGGLDSRLNLAMLHRHVDRQRIQAFTFGFDPRILEYQCAQQVATALELKPPEFFPLTALHYRQALDYLPQQSGGQIGINHSHLLSYLRSRPDIADCTLISTYYTDALYGYACPSAKAVDAIAAAGYYRTAIGHPWLSATVKAAIAADLQQVAQGYDAATGNFGNIDEYLYVTERSQKFHMHLAALQGYCVPMEMPYADYELLQYCLSVPIAHRSSKQILDSLFERHFSQLTAVALQGVSSRDFTSNAWANRGGAAFKGLSSWIEFRGTNVVNAALRQYVSPQLQLLNRYQTEEQERHLHREFKADLRSATAKFRAMGLFDQAQQMHYRTIPRRSNGIADRYALISLAALF